jgi:hypothetical protein
MVLPSRGTRNEQFSIAPTAARQHAGSARRFACNELDGPPLARANAAGARGLVARGAAQYRGLVFVGLVHARDWEPPDDMPAPRPRAPWHVPWRGLAWLAALLGLLFLAPVAARAFGGGAGYAVILLAVTVGLWRLDRWCSRQYWRGLRDYQS